LHGAGGGTAGGREDASGQKHENGGGNSVPPPPPTQRGRGAPASPADRRGGASAGTDTVGQLDRDRAARSEGAARTRDYGAARSGGSPSTGRHRPSRGARAGRPPG